MEHVDVLVVGSGPVGSTFARSVWEQVPGARILMIDAGPEITERAGLNTRNLSDSEALRRAQIASQGPDATSHALTGDPRARIPGGGFNLARPGTHLVDRNGGMPAAALSTCVGGQGAHWTCATPRPVDSERIDFIPDDEWLDLVERAEELLGTTHRGLGDTPQGIALREALSAHYDARLPSGRKVQPMPLAVRVEDGTIVWTGADTVLGPLAAGDADHQFSIRSSTLCRRLRVADGVVEGALLANLVTGEEYEVSARVVVVAADALRTPQLLWASGIRPEALGRFLTEHWVVMSVVALDPEVVPRPEPSGDDSSTRDPILGAIRVPFSDPAFPFQVQAMFNDRCPIPTDPSVVEAASGFSAIGISGRKFPRPEDRVAFSDSRTDWAGSPAMEIHYELTDAELAEVAQAEEILRAGIEELGRPVPGGEPRLMPAGTSLHYKGTVRMGAERDDAQSVCDADSRVWGFENLFVGGNGVIPTATVCNPTLTSVALAVRASRAVAEVLAGGEGAR